MRQTLEMKRAVRSGAMRQAFVQKPLAEQFLGREVVAEPETPRQDMLEDSKTKKLEAARIAHPGKEPSCTQCQCFARVARLEWPLNCFDCQCTSDAMPFFHHITSHLLCEHTPSCLGIGSQCQGTKTFILQQPPYVPTASPAPAAGPPKWWMAFPGHASSRLTMD